MTHAPSKATHQQTRAHNSRLVLKAVFDRERVSRADVARLTGLNRVTVSEIVAELIDAGLIAELERGPSAGGKAPILLGVVADARQVVALDLVGDAFRGAVVNLRGQVCHVEVRPLGGARGAEALAIVCALLDTLVQRASRPLLGIAVGAPGVVDSAHGVVRRAVATDWHEIALGPLLGQRYRLPVHVANASQMIALAHYLFGGAGGPASLAVVRVGREVGAGIVLGGALLTGDGFGAGEIGHLAVVPDGELCGCGNRGCVETAVSSAAVVRRARALAAQAGAAALLARLDGPEHAALAALQDAFRAGDALAAQVARESARVLGRALASLVALLNIRHILLVDAVAAFGPQWLSLVRAEMRGAALPLLADETTVAIAGDDAPDVFRGAAALLLSRELGLSLRR